MIHLNTKHNKLKTYSTTKHTREDEVDKIASTRRDDTTKYYVMKMYILKNIGFLRRHNVGMQLQV